MAAQTVRVLEKATNRKGELQWAYCWWTIGQGESRCVRIEWL